MGAIKHTRSKKMATQKEQAAAIAKQKARADKFVELAQKRVTKAINAIRSIRKLASPNYVYTGEQVNKISEALKAEVLEAHEAFSAKGPVAKETFKL